MQKYYYNVDGIASSTAMAVRPCNPWFVLAPVYSNTHMCDPCCGWLLVFVKILFWKLFEYRLEQLFQNDENDAQLYSMNTEEHLQR